MSLALQKLSEEDPTFRVHTDIETGQTIISGMGELHLEIIIDRLLREFRVDANVGKPSGCLQRNLPGKSYGQHQVCSPERRSRSIRTLCGGI